MTKSIAPPPQQPPPSEDEEAAAYERIAALSEALCAMISASNTKHRSEAIHALWEALFATIDVDYHDKARQMFDQMMRDLAETRVHDPDPESGSTHLH
jgi:hypothetical protein